MKIVLAYDALDDIRTIFREYADSLGVSLGFQSFENELLTLPGRYALPAGRLYMAYEDGAAAGCAALRPLGKGLCEMKRLYVRPAFRQGGIGVELARKIVDDAAEIGYRRIVLDTLETMTEATRLYGRLGFRVIEPYYHNPLPGAMYYGLDLPNRLAAGRA